MTYLIDARFEAAFNQFRYLTIDEIQSGMGRLMRHSLQINH